MIVRAADKKPTAPAPGVSLTVLAYGDRVMLAEIALEKGTVTAAHEHPHEQVSYVVSGTVKFIIGEKGSVLEAGESILLPSSIPHYVEAITDGLLIDAFAPPREDFL